MTGALREARVLVPRGGAWGAAVAADLTRRGAEAIVAPLISSAPPKDVVARDQAFAALADGAYDGVLVTSAAAVEQLVTAGIAIPPHTRVAAVGGATARAIIAAGHTVDVVPDGPSSAAALATAWFAATTPATAGRCLVLRSDLASPLLSDELELRGYRVDVGIAYRTVGVDLPRTVHAALTDGEVDVILLTSLSVARELRRQVGPLPHGTFVASIGPGTTRDAERIGMQVDHTARVQAIDALIADLDDIDRPLHRPHHHPTSKGTP